MATSKRKETAKTKKIEEVEETLPPDFIAEPVSIPPEDVKDERIVSIYLDYETQSASITVGKFTEKSNTEPAQSDTFAVEWKDLIYNDDDAYAFQKVLGNVVKVAKSEFYLGGPDKTDE